tara:strand:+ start:239 stop:688 length:450 start_codon:yes stop_codon:yes gene_type:complete
MQDKNLMNQKKGQIGETMTWIVATLIIVFVLLVSIYVSSLLSKTKNIGSDDFNSEDLRQDLLAKKSLIAFLLSENSNEKTTYAIINEEGKLNSFVEKLTSETFREIYKSSVWFGTDDIDSFKDIPPAITEKIKINEEKLELILKIEENE